MANVFFREGRHRILDRGHSDTISVLTDTLKVMLVKTSFVAAAGLVRVSDSGFTNDPLESEIVVTGYAGGFAGAGRKTLANKSWAIDTGNDRVEFFADDVVWTALGGATNDTIAGAVVYKSLTSDALSPVICFVDTNDLTTNGGDVTLDFSASDGVFFF